MGDKSDSKKKKKKKKKKKIRGTYFLWGIHVWNFKTLAYMVLNLCYAHESNKWPKFAKDHNSNKISLTWLKNYQVTNQYTKYQASSSNTFLDVLLTRFQYYFNMN